MSSNLSQAFLESTVDKLLFQSYYRGLGIVSIHAPLSAVFPAALSLSGRRRGGDIEWVVPGRLAVWFDLVVDPDVSGGPTMSVWLLRSVVGDKNVAIVRFGWWADYTLPNIPGAARLENAFKNRLTVGPVFRWLGAGVPRS